MSEPIYSPGPLDAPVVYVASGTAPLVPLACYAEFDGSSAAGDFKPALIFKSQAGHTFMQAATDETVAAGASAAVSWFPRVGAAASSAVASVGAYAQAFRDSIAGGGDASQQVNAGTAAYVSLPHASTSDSSIISWSTSVNTNDTATLKADGAYLVSLNTHWDATSPNLVSIIQDPTQSDFPHTPIVPSGNPINGDSIGSAQSQDATVVRVSGGSVAIIAQHSNQLGINHFAQQCYFTIVYVPTA